jgi:glycosyltransferase involved in cell wall biosynthesis
MYGEMIHRVAFKEYAAGLGSRLTDQVVSAADSARVAVTRFRSQRPDVVIATAPAIPTLGSGALAALLLRAPLITEMRDAWPDLLTVADQWDDAVPAVPSRISSLLRPALVQAASLATSTLQRRSHAVVTTTETFAEALRHRGIRRVHVIRNGAHPVPGYPAHTQRTPDGELRVLYLGTVGRAQGLGTAVLAARLAHRAGAKVRLRIVGAGAEFDAVAMMAARSEMPIEVLGPVSKEQVGDHYAWADSVLVALRPWPALSLAVPSKLYEAMSLGIHVTAALEGEAARIITETCAGTTVPPGDAQALADAWVRLAANPSGLAVTTAGKSWTEREANDDTLAEQYLSILDDVVGARG